MTSPLTTDVYQKFKNKGTGIKGNAGVGKKPITSSRYQNFKPTFGSPKKTNIAKLIGSQTSEVKKFGDYDLAAGAAPGAYNNGEGNAEVDRVTDLWMQTTEAQAKTKLQYHADLRGDKKKPLEKAEKAAQEKAEDFKGAITLVAAMNTEQIIAAQSSAAYPGSGKVKKVSNLWKKRTEKEEAALTKALEKKGKGTDSKTYEDPFGKEAMADRLKQTKSFDTSDNPRIQYLKDKEQYENLTGFTAPSYDDMKNR